jgi:hypothetical protein
MIYKHKCNQEIYLSVPFVLVSTFGLSSRGVHTYGGTLQIESNSKPIIYYCPHCGILNDLDEVESYCYECREWVNVKDLYYHKVDGATLCSHCIEDKVINPSNLIKISDLLIKRGD